MGRAGQAADVIGELRMYVTDTQYDILGWVRYGKTIRWASAIRQVGNQIYQYRSTDGNPVQLDQNTLPIGFDVPQSGFSVNPNLIGMKYVVAPDWPFGDDIPLLNDARVQWLRTELSPEFAVGITPNELMQVPHWTGAVAQQAALMQEPATVDENAIEFDGQALEFDDQLIVWEAA
jgi:hypothetical protein